MIGLKLKLTTQQQSFSKMIFLGKNLNFKSCLWNLYPLGAKKKFPIAKKKTFSDYKKPFPGCTFFFLSAKKTFLITKNPFLVAKKEEKA